MSGCRRREWLDAIDVVNRDDLDIWLASQQQS
jgi:hypothetical protein